MDVRSETIVVKCPKCKARIKLTQGHYKGGVNDKGGIVIECNTCHTQFATHLKNPNDASGISEGGKKIATWTDRLPPFIKEKYGVDEITISVVDRIIVSGFGDKPPKPEWTIAEKPVFGADGVNFEQTAVAELQKYLAEINKNYKSYRNWYLKRHSADKSFVIIDYEHNSRKYQAVFAKQVDNEKELNAHGLYLIHHSEVNLEVQIDGIYTKSEILVFLGRLLTRWRYTADQILLVVPFIGYNFKGTEKKLQKLWDWLITHVDNSKGQLVTRRGTVNMFRDAQIKDGIPFDLLVEWGLVEPLVGAVSKKGATFEKSHAKYYVGVFENHVEVLSGSFNIHEGPSYENISFRKYDKQFFKNRYLHMLKNHTYPDTSLQEEVHYMTLGTDNPQNLTTSLAGLLKMLR